MDFDKYSATHEWTEARKLYHEEQLRYYKWKEGWWWVFSNLTGWRRSRNDVKWFIEERKLGYFRKLTKEERNGFTA